MKKLIIPLFFLVTMSFFSVATDITRLDSYNISGTGHNSLISMNETYYMLSHTIGSTVNIEILNISSNYDISKISSYSSNITVSGDYLGGYPCLKIKEEYYVINTGNDLLYLYVNSSFNITKIDELTNYSTTSNFNTLVKIDDTHFAQAYTGEGVAGYIATYNINSSSQINILDSLNYAAASQFQSLVKMDDTHLALAYAGDGGDGYISTFSINSSYELSELDSIEHDVLSGIHNSLIKINDTHYLLGYSSNATNGIISAFKINNTYDITKIKNYTFSNVSAFNSLAKINDDKYAIAYEGKDNDGFFKLFEIDNYFNISESYVLEHDTIDGQYNSLLTIDEHYLILAYNGNDTISTFSNNIESTIISSRISPTTAYTTDNILGYCNATDIDDDDLNYYYRWYNGSSLYESGKIGKSFVSNHYDMENLSDSIGTNDFSGTATSNTLIDGVIDGYLRLNYYSPVQTIAYIENLSLSNSTSINIWFKVTELENTWNTLFMFKNESETATLLTIQDNGDIYIANNNYNNMGYAIFSSEYDPNVWNMFSITSSGKIYLNGEYMRSNPNLAETWEDFTLGINQTFYLGYDDSSIFTDDFDGNIDLLTFFNIELTDSDIARLYNSNLGNNEITLLESEEYEIARLPTEIASKGETWTFSCLAYDGYENSSWLNSSTLTISNSAPVISAVAISPSSPNYDSTLTFTNTTTDADSDTITAWSIKWYINGTLSPTLNNVTQISENLTYRETYIINLKAYDGTTWSSSLNSSSVTINDTYEPVYLLGSPTTGTRDTQFTLTLKWYDLLNITSATISMKDPDNIVIYNDEPMVYSSSVLNANGTRNTTYTRTYTPTKSGTYTIVNSTATDEEGNILTRTIGTHIILVSTAPTTVTGGGGGGGSTETSVVTSEFTISPLSAQTTIAPGSKKTIEFTLTNLESRDLQIRLSVSGTGDESRTWVKFQNGLTDDYINLTTSSGLISNKRLVRYTIEVPDDAIEKDYSFGIIASSDSVSTEYRMNLTVGSTFFTWFNQDFWSTEIDYCADDSFETTGELCQNPKTIQLGFGIKEIAIILILAIIITVYMDIRGKKR